MPSSIARLLAHLPLEPIGSELTISGEIASRALRVDGMVLRGRRNPTEIFRVPEWSYSHSEFVIGVSVFSALHSAPDNYLEATPALLQTRSAQQTFADSC